MSMEERGKRLKSELGSGSGSRGKLLKEFDTVFEEMGKRLKSELESRSGSLGKRLKESESRGEQLKEFEERGKRLKSELGSRWGLLKSEPELGSGSKQKLVGDPVEIDYENSPIPHIYYRGDFVYTNKAWKKMEAEMADYRERTRHLSAYDADLAPPRPYMDSCFAPCGGCAPFHITDDNRPTLITLCQLALKDYNLKNNNQGTSFVFHQLVKCATGDAGRGELYYITFQAKAEEEEEEEEEEDTSNSPAIKTFQTRIWHGKDEEPKVEKCAIKT